MENNTHKAWEIVEREDVSPSRWYPVERHVVLLPDDRIVDDYYVSTFEPSVMIVPVHVDGRFVMVRQYKHGIREITLEFPAGGCDSRESRAAAIAELEEETGILVQEDALQQLGFLASASSKSTHRVHMYSVENVTINSEQRLDDNEEIDVVFLTLDEIHEHIRSGSIIGADTIAALYLFLNQG